MSQNSFGFKFPLLVSFVLVASIIMLGQAADQVSPSALVNARPSHISLSTHTSRFGFGKVQPAGNVKFNAQALVSSSLPGINSVANFTGDFRVWGVDPFGNRQNLWLYDMMGNPPARGGTTWFNAPVIPVSVELHDANGNRRVINGHPLVSVVTPDVQPFLNSPVFANASYNSSIVPTQITDAIQRAEFFHRAPNSWHTLLAPSVKTPQTIIVNQSSDPTHPNYLFALNSDGSCCLFILMDADLFSNALFNTIVNAINNGDITPADMSSFVFPNTYLFFNGDPSQCCVLGFHSYVTDEGSPVETRWVFDYSSWISPGLFGAGIQDVTALSHEIAESFNDPFVASDNVHDVTPWWLSPNGNCQDDLEVGDVIEGLPNDVFPMPMNGMTYHPQNEALLPWFEFRSPSDAIDHAYSYPDETTLTSLSPHEGVNCQ